MEKSNFDQLLQRYLTGQVTEQERVKIEAWLDVMKTRNTTDDLELSKDDEDKLFRKITSNTDSVADVISLVPEKRKGLSFWLKIAATFLLVAIASYTGFRLATKGSGWVCEFCKFVFQPPRCCSRPRQNGGLHFSPPRTVI